MSFSTTKNYHRNHSFLIVEKLTGMELNSDQKVISIAIALTYFSKNMFLHRDVTSNLRNHNI